MFSLGEKGKGFQRCNALLLDNTAGDLVKPTHQRAVCKMGQYCKGRIINTTSVTGPSL